MNVCRLSPGVRSPNLFLPVTLAAIVLQLTISPAVAGNQVLAWGNNNAGQIEVPQGLTDVAAISGGASHSVALRKDGTVVCWGMDLFGQSTPPANLSSVLAIAAGSAHTLALKSDGTVEVWGNQPKAPAGLGAVKAIAAGYSHSLALTTSGEVVSWGSQPNVPANLGVIVAVAGGNNFSLGLRADGTLVAWGDPAFGKTEVPPGLSNVVAIATGGDHCLALQSSGTVVAWGGNYSGQAAVPETLSNVVAIAAGAAHSLALRADGTYTAWGDNTFRQSVVNPTLNRFAAVAAGGYHSLAIWGDGAPAILVQPRNQTVPIGSDPNFFVLVAGNQPLNYQWLKGGNVLPAKTRAMLTLSNVQESDNGQYSVKVSNPLGTVFSATATLTVLPIPPVITTQPLDQTTTCGDGSAVFRVIAEGSPLTYQWYFNDGSTNELLLGATKSTYTLSNVTTNEAGKYSAVISNPYGATTSAVATLTVLIAPPSITSPLFVSSKQGAFMNYAITALHNPSSFSAKDLPPGLTLDPTNGIISGYFLLSGTFYTTVIANNPCTSDSAVIVFDVSDSVPSITSALTVTGTEGVPLNYQITASNTTDTNWPTLFRAHPLPMGLTLNPNTGLISGVPVLPGTYRTSISASNAFGVGAAVVQFTINNGTIAGLSIDNILTNYTSPYLLDFQFSLRDNNEPKLGNSIVIEPRLLSVRCLEDDIPISSNETAVVIARGNSKVLKAYLVLDFTASMADVVSNGDTNRDGISDAIETMVGAAQTFVDQMPGNALIGVYEFHREDQSPSNVVSLTTDKVRLNKAIAGIWTNYVNWFPAGSRCWDATAAAVKDLGAGNPDEQHYVILVSDGVDESSTEVLTNLITTASNANVHVYALGFGEQLPLGITNLTSLATNTGGHYYTATTTAGLASEFGQIIKDLNGQYILRWATLKRTTPFWPSFQISYQGYIATSPPPTWYTNFDDPIIDTNDPPSTNYPIVTNFVIAPYDPTKYAGDVKVGALRLVPNSDVRPTGITLRTSYAPRYIRHIQLNYRANWPCTVSLASTNLGEILYGWTMTETNAADGSTWLTLVSPPPQDLGSSLLFGAFGNLLDFSFKDAIPTNTAFSLLQVDNSLYTNTSLYAKQSWAFASTNLNAYVKLYPPLPYGTPVPWLIQYGLTPNYTNLEVADSDGDGALNWEEYRANTIPTNAASRFALLSLGEAYNGLNEVTFIGGSNRVFRLEVSTDLLNWWTAADNIPGSGGPITVSDRNYWTETNIFYRALVY